MNMYEKTSVRKNKVCACVCVCVRGPSSCQHRDSSNGGTLVVAGPCRPARATRMQRSQSNGPRNSPIQTLLDAVLMNLTPYSGVLFLTMAFSSVWMGPFWERLIDFAAYLLHELACTGPRQQSRTASTRPAADQCNVFGLFPRYVM
jgi:hypothetical protein